MTNYIVDAVADAALQYIEDNVTTLHVCSGDPADRAAVLTNSLGNVTIDASDFTIANGDTSGRKSTLAQQSIASASASGTAAVAALINGSVLVLKADLASTQAITSGNPITVNAFDCDEIRDPA